MASRTATTTKLADPGTAVYPGFDPALATLVNVQVVFRHGARTPLNQLYSFPGANWTHCRDHYPGVEVELYDERGGAEAPPILDMHTPELPGGCKEGTLTEAGFGMALELGSVLRARYVTGAALDPLLPDLQPASGGGGGGAGLPWDPAHPAAALRSSPVRRTVATLRGVLTGLWPALAEGEGRALPVGASREPYEIMYGGNNTCPRLVPLYEAMQRDLDAADARDPALPLLARTVGEALGLDAGQPIKWTKLYDVLAAMTADRAALPRGATLPVLGIIEAQAARHEAGVIGPGPELCASLGPGGDGGGDSARRRRCHEVLRLGIGMLVRRLMDNMDERVAGGRTGGRTDGGGGTAGGGSSKLGDGELERERAGAAARADAAAADPREVSLSARGDLLGGGSGAAVLGRRGQQQQRGQQRHQQHHRRQLQQQQRRVAQSAGGGAAAGGAASPAPQQRERPEPPPLYLYSGHDSSVTPLLAVLGQPALAWPRFAANVVFELWRAGGSGGGGGGGGMGRRGGLRGQEEGPVDPEYWVRVLYNWAPLVVPGLSNSGGWLPLSVLRQKVFLPYAIGPEEHLEVCRQVELPPELTDAAGGDEYGGGGVRHGDAALAAAAGGGRVASGAAAGGDAVAPAPVLHRRAVVQHATL